MLMAEHRQTQVSNKEKETFFFKPGDMHFSSEVPLLIANISTAN